MTLSDRNAHAVATRSVGTLPKTGQASVIVPVGALGAGIKAEHVARGIAMGADAIACDAGSTDSGASYLSRGVSKVSREAVKKDLAVLIEAGHRAGIPVLVGSCATAGTDAGVDWTAEIAAEIARELGIAPRIILLKSEQSAATLCERNALGKIRPLPPMGPLDDAVIDRCDHIVALMGPEPYIEAIKMGATIVLGGRTTDTAVLAAVPLMRGCDVAASWHAGKIAECGGLCTSEPDGGGVLMRIGSDSFEIEPLNADTACTPYTVSAHMLYENSDPFELYEPGGVLDVRMARYEAVDDRVTRVTGMAWRSMPYSMKLEGATAGPSQTIMFVGIADPIVLGSVDLFVERLHTKLIQRVADTIGDEAGDFDISLRAYGWNGVSGRAPRAADRPPHELGMMFVATAASQEIATRIAKTCNPYFFHFPLHRGKELPSYGFPFSPAEVERGPVYEFLLNHVVEVEDGLELVRIETYGED